MQNRIKSVVFAMAVTMVTSAHAQQPDFDNVEVKTIEVVDGVYMLEGFGGNIGVSIGTDGVIRHRQSIRTLGA
jgi:cyclase